MMNQSQPNDGLEIPDFLKVTSDEQSRRIEYARLHPVGVTQFSAPPERELSAEDQAALDSLEDERKAADKVKRANRNKHKDLVAAQDRAISDGKVWRNGQWVDPDAMPRSKACRIMRDLPTDQHRAIFLELYGDNIVGGKLKLKNGVWK